MHPFGHSGHPELRDDTLESVPRDLMAEMRQQRADNYDRIVALVREILGRVGRACCSASPPGCQHHP